MKKSELKSLIKEVIEESNAPKKSLAHRFVDTDSLGNRNIISIFTDGTTRASGIGARSTYHYPADLWDLMNPYTNRIPGGKKELRDATKPAAALISKMPAKTVSQRRKAMELYFNTVSDGLAVPSDFRIHRWEAYPLDRKVVEESKVIEESWIDDVAKKYDLASIFNDTYTKTEIESGSDFDKLMDELYDNAREVVGDYYVENRNTIFGYDGSGMDEEDIQERLHESFLETFDEIFEIVLDELSDEAGEYYQNFVEGYDTGKLDAYSKKLSDKYVDLTVESIEEGLEEIAGEEKYGHPSLSAAERNR